MRRDPYGDYQKDPMFKALVDSFYQVIKRAEVTPAECRQALIVACARVQAESPAFMDFTHQTLEELQRGVWRRGGADD